jgi:hypothetical protein
MLCVHSSLTNPTIPANLLLYNRYGISGGEDSVAWVTGGSDDPSESFIAPSWSDLKYVAEWAGAMSMATERAALRLTLKGCVGPHATRGYQRREGYSGKGERNRRTRISFLESFKGPSRYENIIL